MADSDRNLVVFENKGYVDSHNGMPSYDFTKTFAKPYLIANATRSDKQGYSLTSQYQGKSQGQINYGGGGGAGNDAQQQANAARNEIAFNQLVKVFPVNCSIRRELEEDYINEPYYAWEFVVGKLQLPMEDSHLQEISKEWNELNYDSISSTTGVSNDSIFLIMQHIRKVGELFIPEKTIDELRNKFLKCLPEQLEASGDQETGSPDASLNFPATYPATHVKSVIARRADANAALPVHPNAGECNLEKLCEKFAKVWRSKAGAGKVRFKDPQKIVNVNFMTDGSEDECSPDEILYYAARAPADEKTRCYWCGGLGHFSSNYDATLKQVVKCRTTIKIDAKILEKIVYPHIENIRVKPKGKGKGGRGGKGYKGRGGHQANQIEQQESKQQEEDHDEDDDNYNEENMALLQHAQIDDSWSR